MTSILKKYIHSLSAFLVVLASAPYAQADDTEIYFGNPSGNGTIPNVLFILDNSGSMSTNITTQSIFDHTITYTGSNDSAYAYAYDGGTYEGSILLSNSHCKTLIDKLNTAGQYSSAKVAVYKNKRWRSILTDSWTESGATECKDDRKVHGQNGTTTNNYARSGYNKSMWTSKKDKELGWNNIKTLQFYSANYLNWYYDHRITTSQSRLSIMKGVVNNLVDSTAGINIGLMSFNTNNSGTQGGRVNVPLGNINTNKADFKAKLNSLGPDTWTPLAETLFEAKRYFQGGKVFLGSQSVAASKDPNDSAKYESPIAAECQPNNIVLLTDGAPTYDAHLSGNYNYTNDTNSRAAIEADIGRCSGNCLEEVAKNMRDKDLRGDLLDDQTVNTYTIGFDINDPFLKETAEGDGTSGNIGGGGKYFTADNTEELDSALKSIITDIKSTNTTFVTPGVAVNTFNRLNHRDELYYSVFKPDLRPEWGGNLKRYRLGSDGVIYDANKAAAIEPSTGYFKKSSQSWWSNTIDGEKVVLGGAASKLPPLNKDRKVYTYSGVSKALTDATNEVSTLNKTNISKTLLGIPSATDAEQESLINWIRGIDSQDEDGDGDKAESRKVIMDPLHSPPVVVIYGGTDAAPDSAVFFGDNQGFIHGINTKTVANSGYGNSPGEEHFSFIPQDLLGMQKDLYDNSTSSGHPYGMDGAISTWINDENNDNDLYDAKDFVYLYAGMRRGGNNYYALDVTKRTAPEMLWQIKGGASGDAGFKELGQTWSQPAVSRIKVGTTEKDVLIFAGGYDTAQDAATARAWDSIGRAVYIVDAKTGALIWSGGPSTANSKPSKIFDDMRYSIPSSIRIIDVNGDDLVDQMYVGDMGGQVWRFDINNGSPSSSLVDGAVIATLADNTTAGNRRFYHEPSASVIIDGGARKLAIAIASGWQAHPLAKTTEDRFYLLKDANLTKKPRDADKDGKPDYHLYDESKLYDASDNHLGHVSASNTTAQQVQANIELGQKGGWYIRLPNTGEKSLASALIFNNEILFTTYEPKANSNGCTASVGTPRLYHINLKDASPVKNYDSVGSDTELTVNDRSKKLATTGLPTEAIRLRVDGQNVVCVGTECDPYQTKETVIETYWIEEK